MFYYYVTIYYNIFYYMIFYVIYIYIYIIYIIWLLKTTAPAPAPNKKPQFLTPAEPWTPNPKPLSADAGPYSLSPSFIVCIATAPGQRILRQLSERPGTLWDVGDKPSETDDNILTLAEARLHWDVEFLFAG